MTNLIDMHGRKVIKSEVPEGLDGKYFCYDCGATPKFLITELLINPPEWNPLFVFDPLETWFWCGECDIGG